MKKLTCKDLGGSCEEELHGASFEEMGEASKAHVMEKVAAGDVAHQAAAAKMGDASPEEQQAMMAEFRKRYEEAEIL
jgi:hypothetical protein